MATQQNYSFYSPRCWQGHKIITVKEKKCISYFSVPEEKNYHDQKQLKAERVLWILVPDAWNP